MHTREGSLQYSNRTLLLIYIKGSLFFYFTKGLVLHRTGCISPHPEQCLLIFWSYLTHSLWLCLHHSKRARENFSLNQALTSPSANLTVPHTAMLRSSQQPSGTLNNVHQYCTTWDHFQTCFSSKFHKMMKGNLTYLLSFSAPTTNDPSLPIPLIFCNHSSRSKPFSRTVTLFPSQKWNLVHPLWMLTPPQHSQICKNHSAGQVREADSFLVFHPITLPIM